MIADSLPIKDRNLNLPSHAYLSGVCLDFHPAAINSDAAKHRYKTSIFSEAFSLSCKKSCNR